MTDDCTPMPQWLKDKVSKLSGMPFRTLMPKEDKPKHPKPVEGFTTPGGAISQEFRDFWRDFHAGPDAEKERKPSSELPPDPAVVLPPGVEGGGVTVPVPSSPSPLQQELMDRQKRKTAGLPEYPPTDKIETAADWAADMPDPFAED